MTNTSAVAASSVTEAEAEALIDFLGSDFGPRAQAAYSRALKLPAGTFNRHFKNALLNFAAHWPS